MSTSNAKGKIMGFCSYSTHILKNGTTEVDNVFITDFMLDAPDIAVKVYLYGLYLCNQPDSTGNDLDSIARLFEISSDDVISCFMYFENLGLVSILQGTPVEVKYLPAKFGSRQLKKYNADKYKSFNIASQEILTGHMITPTEYQEYYDIIESKHIEADAMLMIIKYCANLKGNNVGHRYITTVASNWAFDGVHTTADVEAKLKDMELRSGDIQSIIKALGLSRSASIDEYESYKTWTSDLGYNLDTILHLANMAKKKRGGFSKLNSLITKCYSAHLFSIREIDDYFKNLDSLYEIARQVTKNLGVRYENIETVVDNYLTQWIMLGFDKDTIIKISEYCFFCGIRTLNSMNAKMTQLQKMGLFTLDALNSYIQNQSANDDKILNILNALSLNRAVNSSDRNMYKTWTIDYGMADDIIDYAVSISADKYMPMQYLSRILSSYHDRGIKTVEEAKKFTPDFGRAKSNTMQNTRSYTKEELSCLFTPIDEIEL